MDKCPDCGSDKRNSLYWECGSRPAKMYSDGSESNAFVSETCLKRQLAAANAKLAEAARLAQDSAKQADKMAGMGEDFERAGQEYWAWTLEINRSNGLLDAYFATGEKEG